MDDRFFMLIGFVVGLGPTFGLLWAVMSRYENRIAERDTNSSFVLGIFAGLVVIVGHLFFIVSYSFSSIGLISAFGLALAECLLYFIFLNRRKFKKRSDKAFLGLGFALGTASMYIAFLMGQLFLNIQFHWGHILGMVVYSFGASTIRGSMGILVSRSSERKNLFKNLAIGTAILGIFNIATIVYLNPFPHPVQIRKKIVEGS
jgi:peptidoglycan biosynthesis protein MviN/MurJ (putative lipid II flippase)